MKGPLDVLAQRLLVGPPSLRHLLEAVVPSEEARGFMELVREYLPDLEESALDLTPYERVQAFGEAFGERYFPLDLALWEDGAETYYELIMSLPLRRSGFTWDEYHEMPKAEPGFRLLLALIGSPFREWDDQDGARVPLLESCRPLVGRALLKRVPQEGYHPTQLHNWLDGTPYEPLAHLGDWLWRQTETVFLDITYEHEVYDDMWDRETVEYLAEQWPRAREIQQKVSRMAAWLEEDPRVHFRELLEFIQQRAGEPSAGAETLAEIFSGEEELT